MFDAQGWIKEHDKRKAAMNELKDFARNHLARNVSEIMKTCKMAKERGIVIAYQDFGLECIKKEGKPDAEEVHFIKMLNRLIRTHVLSELGEGPTVEWELN